MEEFTGSGHARNPRALATGQDFGDIGVGVLTSGLAERLSKKKYANSLFEWRNVRKQGLLGTSGLVARASDGRNTMLHS